MSASYAERPKQELVRLDACEVIASPLSDPIDYTRAAALAFYAEVLEEALPDHDPHEAVFRLLLAVLEHSRGNVSGCRSLTSRSGLRGCWAGCPR